MMLIDIFGYLAIAVGLFAISRKSLFSLRLWHLISSILYLIYGLFTLAYPVIVSGVLFIFIHLYNLNKIVKQRDNKSTTKEKPNNLPNCHNSKLRRKHKQVIDS